MAHQPDKPRVLRLLEKRNPQVTVEKARTHWKILVNGMFIGIYPLTPRREGFAENTKSALRSAGVQNL